MKIPNIICVDDEENVLDRITEKLEQDFSNVERFPNSDECLDWLNENKGFPNIFVLDKRLNEKVDGIQLAAKIKEIDPGSRRITLTGYADFNDAITAFNNEVIHKFIIKDNIASLNDIVKQELKQYMIDNELDKHFVFKEIDDEETLKEYFRIRYDVYSFLNYIDSNADRLDIDSYDYYSYFLGAFERGFNGERLVGTMRMVGKEKIEKNKEILKYILNNTKDLKTLEIKEHNFPSISAFPNANNLDNLKQVFDSNLSEVGRLTILPELRKTGINTRFAEFATSMAWNFDINYAIVCCHPRHKKLYTRLGFEHEDKLEEVIYPGINNSAIFMHVDTSKILSPHKENAEALLSQFREQKYSSTCRSYKCLSEHKDSEVCNVEFYNKLK